MINTQKSLRIWSTVNVSLLRRCSYNVHFGDPNVFSHHLPRVKGQPSETSDRRLTAHQSNRAKAVSHIQSL